MRNNPIKLATGAKGVQNLMRRVDMIRRRYGHTTEKMDLVLAQFVEVLERYDCQATFPIPAVVVERHPEIVNKFQTRGIEFGVHGYVHVDYSRLSKDEQSLHIRKACDIFATMGVNAVGFRSPYLCRNTNLDAVIETLGFSYVSNQPVAWDVLNLDELTQHARASYDRALRFYECWDASERLSMPRLKGSLIEIPISLPDDEILLDRLGGDGRGLVGETWQRILALTYQSGELFTIQLHPERFALCAEDLVTVLKEARRLSPSVWLARMDEAAAWWQKRSAASVEIKETMNGVWEFYVNGPPGMTILARGVETIDAGELWADGYRRIFQTQRAEGQTATITVYSASRPCIGISPTSSPAVADFLQQQGYFYLVGEDDQRYSIYIDLPDFIPENERTLLTRIEQESGPLVRLGCWPNGARSALCITGDIDALTLWDYGMRLIGK